MATISPVSDLRNYNTVLEKVSVGSPVYLTVNGRGKYTIRDISEDEEFEKGEKITYFITERREDGTERSMPLVTLEKERDVAQSHTKYSSINRMRKLAATGKQALLAKEAEQCRFLEMAAEQLFPLK